MIYFYIYCYQIYHKIKSYQIATACYNDSFWIWIFDT